jgi:hypothetical protein
MACQEGSQEVSGRGHTMNRVNHAQEVAAAVLTLALSSCGGGGGGGSSTPPSALHYSTPQTYIVNSAIPPLTPTVGGTVTNYTISPALPAGLTLNPTTGVISGTPTQVSAQVSYEVIATNAFGKTNAGVAITIEPGIAYGSAYYSFTSGVMVSKISPTVGAPSGAAWSVTPALPAGLTLDSAYGNISGTPTAASPAASYTVTAKTSSGTSSVTLTLVVAAAPLLDVGHAYSIVSIQVAGSRLLTQDSHAHWVLWNYTTDENLANGTTGNDPYRVPPNGEGVLPYPTALAGSTAVVQSASAIEVLSATDGTVQAQITGMPSWWTLATDGSYIATGTSSGLTVYSPSGTVLFTRAGNYASAVAFASPTQLQVGLGAAGANVIETLAVPGGTSSVGAAFLGTFQSWFLDGGNFITATGNTVWIYPNGYTSQNDFQGPAVLPTLSQLAGTGNWFWTYTSPLTELNVYKVGVTGTSPAPSYTLPASQNAEGALFPTPTALGALTDSGSGTGTLVVVDLSNSATLSTTSYTTPPDQLTAYGAAGSTWLVGNTYGVLYDGASYGGTPRYMDYGLVTAIAGSAPTFALATASSRILYYNASTNALVGTISQPASDLQLSADGTVLAAAPGFAFMLAPNQVVDIWSLPAATLTTSFSGSPGITLSASGTALGEVFGSGACAAQVIAVPSGTSQLCVPQASASVVAVLLNADGSGAATPLAYNIQADTNYSTNVYVNGALATTVPGIVVGWLTPTTYLLATYTFQGSMAAEGYYYNASSIYNTSGAMVSSVTLPDTGMVQTLSETSVYSPSNNAIYSLANGGNGIATWSSGSPQTAPVTYGVDNAFGVVAGSEVVFVSNNLVLAEPYQ